MPGRNCIRRSSTGLEDERDVAIDRVFAGVVLLLSDERAGAPVEEDLGGGQAVQVS